MSGCSLVAKPADVVTESPTQTITGVIKVTGDLIVINQQGVGVIGKSPDGVTASTTEITSRKIDLKKYDGQTVTVTGEFSGTTLFVDKVR